MTRAIILRNANGQFTSIHPLPPVKTLVLTTVIGLLVVQGLKMIYKKVMALENHEEVKNGQAEIDQETTTKETDDNTTDGNSEMAGQTT